MSDTLADGQVKGQRFDLDYNGPFDLMNDLKLKSVILPHEIRLRQCLNTML